MAQQDAALAPPGERRGIGEAAFVGGEATILDGVAGDGGVAAAGERGDLVEEAAAPGYHFRPSRRVVTPRRWRRAKRVGAVQRVVEAAPAGVGGVQGIARVAQRNDELGSGDRGDLRIDALGADGEGRRRVDQVIDLAEEGFLLGRRRHLAAKRCVARVDPRLQIVALAQQPPVLGRQLAQQAREAKPEALRRNARAGKRLLLEESLEAPVDLDAGDERVGRGCSLGRIGNGHRLHLASFAPRGNRFSAAARRRWRVLPLTRRFDKPRIIPMESECPAASPSPDDLPQRPSGGRRRGGAL